MKIEVNKERALILLSGGTVGEGEYVVELDSVQALALGSTLFIMADRITPAAPAGRVYRPVTSRY